MRSDSTGKARTVGVAITTASSRSGSYGSSSSTGGNSSAGGSSSSDGALSVSAEGDCYLCVPPDPGIEAAALGAGESALLGTAPAEPLHTFSLSSLHLPSFSTNLVSTAALQDAMVTTTTPGVAPPPWSPLPATPSWLALAPPSFWSPRPAFLALRGGSALLLPPRFPRRLLPCILSTWTCGGQDRKRYFLLVVDDYTHYTMVFPLRSKGEVPDVLIPWICTIRLQLRERFREDLPVLRLHSDRGGEFSSNLLRKFCHGEGILQLFTLPASPQQDGVAEHCIGLVMELNLWPHVSLPETSPTLRWTGKVGDASVFRVWGSRAFVRDPSADKFPPTLFTASSLDSPLTRLAGSFTTPSRAVSCPVWTSRLTSRFPFTVSSPSALPLPPPLPLFLASGPPPVDPLPPQGPAPSGVSHVDPLPLTVPVKVAVDLGAARGAASGGAASGGAELGGTCYTFYLLGLGLGNLFTYCTFHFYSFSFFSMV
ncbi:unnamed protein product [Closterium sp. NIES-54]